MSVDNKKILDGRVAFDKCRCTEEAVVVEEREGGQSREGEGVIGREERLERQLEQMVCTGTESLKVDVPV